MFDPDFCFSGHGAGEQDGRDLDAGGGNGGAGGCGL